MADNSDGSTLAVIWLSNESPHVFMEGIRTDYPDVHLVTFDGQYSAYVAPNLRLAAPVGWTSADKLVALANSNLLDPYSRLVIVESAPPILDQTKLAISALTDARVGGVFQSEAPVSAQEYKQVGAVLKDLGWPMPPRQAVRPSGFDIVCRAFVLQGLRALRLVPGEVRPNDSKGAARDFLTALISMLCVEAEMRLVAAADVDLKPARARLSPRIVPFYLPQFHPTKENDAWWGRGFTEWTNVSTAGPNYRKHFQPKLPADLGFYDLRVDSVREQQANLAESSSIEGFMYYHYWFAGERLLDLPLNRLQQQEYVDQKFCLMWANEDWSRSWDGDPSTVLVAQEYDRVPAERFIDDSMSLLLDRRYPQIYGKQLLAVYRPSSIPGFSDVARSWREKCAAAGIDLFILGVEYFGISDLDRSALDGTMSFPPHQKTYVPAASGALGVKRDFRGKLLSYQELVDADIRTLGTISDSHMPGVMPSWDNTPRRGRRAHVWVGANPYTYRRWLLAAAEAVAHRPEDARLVFVNAWNEWAEGAVLEPSSEFGHAYLHATRDVGTS